jgi:outer membrane protein assembly factor BamB
VFRALEKKTGKVRWSYDTTSDGDPVQFHTDPVVVDDLIVTGSDLVHGVARVYAFERETGKPRWKRDIGWGASGDVLRVGSNVYVVTYQDELLCLDWKTGEPVWKFATGHKNDEAGRGANPAAANGRVFFGSLDGTVYALDGNSGAVVWKRALGAAISTSVLSAGGSLYVGSANRHLYRLDSKTGAVTADYSANERPDGRLLATEDSVLAFFSEQKLVSLASSLASVRWTEASSGPWTSSRPYAWKGAILAGNQRGELFALKPSDGAHLWSGTFEGAIRGIGSDDEVLYIGTIRGRVYAWAPPKAP